MKLSDIRQAAATKYGDLPVELEAGGNVLLQNLLRMPKAQRKALTKIQERLDAIQGEDETAKAAELGEGEDDTDAIVRLVREAIELVADSKANAKALLDEIGDDLPTLMAVFEEYGATSQPGEATPSGT